MDKLQFLVLISYSGGFRFHCRYWRCDRHRDMLIRHQGDTRINRDRESLLATTLSKQQKVKVKAAHTRLQSVGFRTWSPFLAVSVQVMWVINPEIGCHYFPPGLQLPSQPLKWLLPISLRRGCDLIPGSTAPESRTLTTRLPSQPQSTFTCGCTVLLCILSLPLISSSWFWIIQNIYNNNRSNNNKHICIAS